MNFEDSILKIGSKLTMLPSTILLLIGESNNLSVQMDTPYGKAFYDVYN